MGHAIHALVMSPVDARALVAQHAELRAFALPQGFAIVPLNHQLIDALAERSNDDDVVRALSSERTFAEVETDYFGGTGKQRAAVWRNCEAIFSTSWRKSDAINEALRMLGVRRTASDEFDALELVRFRRYDAFERANPL
jgi:hypothetical protein